MWSLPLLCVLGLGLVQVQAKGISTQMFYFTLAIDENAFDEYSELLLDRDVTADTFSLRNITKTTECDVLDTGLKTCQCAEGFRWSDAACSSEPQCCLNEPCKRTFSCRAEEMVTISGSLQLLNPFYHGCLNDKTTDDFKTCHKNVTDEIQTAYSSISGFDSVKVLKYRTGSVIVDFVVTIISNVDPSLLQATSVKLLETFNASMELQTTGVVQMSAPQGPLEFNSSVTLTCTSSTDLGSQPNWNLFNYKNESKPIFGGTESKIIADALKSRLHLSSLSLNWKGTYNCSFTQAKGKLKIHHAATAALDVCVVPRITISTEPGFPRCHQDSDLPEVSVRCEVEEVHEEFNVTWEKKDISARLIPKKVSYDSGVKIFSAQTFVACSSKKPKITCRLKNKCNQTQVSTTEVILIRVGDKFCPEQGSWKDTPVGYEAVIRCSGSVGTRVRPCNADGTWGEEISKCVDLKLKSVLNEAITSDIGQGELQKNAGGVFGRLQSVTENTNVVNSAANLNASVLVIDTMSNKLPFLEDKEVAENFLASSSNLLNKSLEVSWKSAVHDERNASLAEKYLHSVEQLISKTNLSSQTKNPNLEVVSCNKADASQCSNHVFNCTVTMDSQGGPVKTAGYLQLINYLPSSENDSFPNSIIITTTGNITGKINIQIKFQLIKPRPRNTELKCVFWDTDSRKWSGKGCNWIGGADQGLCECDHLSAFSILMSKGPLHVPYLSEITYAGLSVSIVSLIIFLVVELIIWNDVVKTDTLHLRHCAHVNISICLLVGDVCFLASSLPGELSDVWCQTFVLVQHFCFLAMFFWMLCLSSILLHKTVYVSLHGVSKTAYLRYSVILGYVCPLLIVVITFLSHNRAEGQYYSKETRWLVYSGLFQGSIFTFILPVGIIVFINVFFMCLVIMKLLQPMKAQQMLCDKEKNSAKTVIRSVILLTPVFGLTWGLGFLMILMDLTEGIRAYTVNYLFTIMNAFQGLYIFLTTCVGDKMVREGLQRYFKKQSKGVSSLSSSSNVSRSSIKK